MPRSIPEQRFQDLIDAATRVFIQQGYRRTQMADVAEALGVAKGTLYLYVASKEALFDAVLRHADAQRPIASPELPIQESHATGAFVRERLAERARLPVLAAALERSRVTDARAELESVVRELYEVLERNRTGIKLLDRCALDHPELAAAWTEQGRHAAMHQLTRYVDDRVRRRRFRRLAEPALAARMLLEVAVHWAVHRHWDPLPAAWDDKAACDAVVAFACAAWVDA